MKIEILTSTSDSSIPTLGMGIQESIENTPQPQNYAVEQDILLPEHYTLSGLENVKFNVSPIIDNFLYKENISIIGAKPKVGKSTLMRFLSKCLVDGDDFLGRKTYSGKVLYLAMEEPLANIQRDFKAMDVLNKNDLIITTLSGEPNKIISMEKLIQHYKPSLVVIDTMIHITNINDINDYAQTTSSLNKIRAIAVMHNCHILLVHHSKKGESQGNDSAVLGSTGLTGAVDLIIQLEMDSNKVRLISSNGRSGEHFNKNPLSFDDVKMHFSNLSAYVASSKQKLIDLIKNNPGITRGEIKENIQIRNESLTSELNKLVNDKVVRSEKRQNKSVYFINEYEGDGAET